MKPKDPVAQSVHDRLLALASSRKEDFNALLIQYGNERLLYRLTCTPHAKRFILKGASLFLLWFGQFHRPTRDLDLLGSGDFTPAVLKAIFEDVCAQNAVADGVTLDASSIAVSNIREDQDYQGMRVKLRGFLGTARLSLQIDIGFGDAVTPSPKQVTFPTILDMPAPRLKVYPRETTIAEKIDAIMDLGIKNSRMKDYFDLQMLCLHFPFDAQLLCLALRATLTRRGRIASNPSPVGLSDAFATDPVKMQQWKAFAHSHRSLNVSTDFHALVETLRSFAGPIILAVVSEIPFKARWNPGGPWRLGGIS